MKSMKHLAESLQGTSRVLSARGATEQASIQEAVIQLLGLIILDGIEPRMVDDSVPPVPGADVRHKVRTLELLGTTVWVGTQTGCTVLAKPVDSEEDWQGLPVFLQNHVARKHFPCHLLVFIEQMSLPGDTQHRHYAEPIFVILRRAGVASLESSVVLGASEMRKVDQVQATREAMAHIDPFMRVAFAGILQAEKEVVV